MSTLKLSFRFYAIYSFDKHILNTYHVPELQERRRVVPAFTELTFQGRGRGGRGEADSEPMIHLARRKVKNKGAG